MSLEIHVVCTTNKAHFAGLSFTFCSLQKAENSYIFSFINPLNMDALLIQFYVHVCCCLDWCLIIWKFDTSSICMLVHVVFYGRMPAADVLQRNMRGHCTEYTCTLDIFCYSLVLHCRMTQSELQI